MSLKSTRSVRLTCQADEKVSLMANG